MPKASKKTTKKATKKTAAKKVAKKSTVKTAAKKATKKTTAKKNVVSKKTKKPLITADNETAFWVTNGMVLDSLLALRDALDEMEEEAFAYHVNQDKNDFAVWVHDVLCDAACAEALATASTPKKAKTVVVRHLKLYTI